MNNYEEFIETIGAAPDFPQNIYGKVRFRVVAENIALPVATVFLFLVFAGILSFSMNSEKQPLDWNFGAEEIIFAHNNNFYSLFDE